MDINLENWNTQNMIHTSNEVQEERRRTKSEQGSGKGWVEKQGEGRGLMGLSGSGGLEKGKSFEMYINISIN